MPLRAARRMNSATTERKRKREREREREIVRVCERE